MAACSGLLEVAVVCAKVGEKVGAGESLVAVRPENHSRVISFIAGAAARCGALWCRGYGSAAPVQSVGPVAGQVGREQEGPPSPR